VDPLGEHGCLEVVISPAFLAIRNIPWTEAREIDFVNSRHWGRGGIGFSWQQPMKVSITWREAYFWASGR
jgi:hypothetical protein